MEILLLQDVTNVGKKDDLLVVGDGFALNYLLPRRLAIVATPVVRRRFGEAIKARAEQREKERQAQLGAATALAGKAVRFVRKVTKTGKLYGAISEENIVQALKEQYAIDIAPALIIVQEPIKSTGTVTVRADIAGQKVPITVVVEAEKAETKAKTKKM
ncbi:MAG: large subunit ribosomal protein L9 [Candidatus Peregrinibacteria bacterium Gr01-1014_25]|nr:MAG: large subunit ribosomal protein L9 [Candidatus Peregrinibacteria bacterium Gr01-1014_25]